MKTIEELIEDFLANGGEIEKLEPAEYENKQTIGSASKKSPEIMTLAEGRDMFGEKHSKKQTKKKEVPEIDLSLIPEHLHHIIDNVKKENK